MIRALTTLHGRPPPSLPRRGATPHCMTILSRVLLPSSSTPAALQFAIPQYRPPHLLLLFSAAARPAPLGCVPDTNRRRRCPFARFFPPVPPSDRLQMLACRGAGSRATPHSLLPPPQQHCTSPQAAPRPPSPFCPGLALSPPFIPTARCSPACLLSFLTAASLPRAAAHALDRAMYPRRRPLRPPTPPWQPILPHALQRFYFIALCCVPQPLPLLLVRSLPGPRPAPHRAAQHTTHPPPSPRVLPTSSQCPYPPAHCTHATLPQCQPPPPASTIGGPLPRLQRPVCRLALRLILFPFHCLPCCHDFVASSFSTAAVAQGTKDLVSQHHPPALHLHPCARRAMT